MLKKRRSIKWLYETEIDEKYVQMSFILSTRLFIQKNIKFNANERVEKRAKEKKKMGNNTHCNMENADFSLELNNILVEKFACTVHTQRIDRY